MGGRDAGAKVLMGFELGSVCATPGALGAIEEAGQTPGDFLQRHLSGDWGEMDAHDSRLNDAAVRSGEDRILSAYTVGDGTARVWIITEWDRSTTTILLPSGAP